MPPIISIQFAPTGKQYHFDAQGITDLVPGDRVVVETTRGRQLGIFVAYVPDNELDGRGCKPIERRATARDLVMQQQWQAKELNALIACQELAEKQGLGGYKFVKAEYNFDGSQVTILYSTERKKGDLGALQRELRRSLRAKVELFQIGPRDFAKVLDGLGACGEQRCCSRFLTKFGSVSIRMAKLQNISLAPSEITGVCGRLRCCLAYEYEQYAEAAKGLPRRGKEVVTPYGKGKVIELRTLAGAIVVDVNGVRHVVQREDIGKQEFTHPAPQEEKWPGWLEPDADSGEPAPAEKARAAPRPAQEGPPPRSQRRRRPRDQAKPAGRDKGTAEASRADSQPARGERKSSRRRRPRRGNQPGKQA